jgi:hypothetical protein
LEAAQKALERDRSGPYLTLAAITNDALGQKDSATAMLREAMTLYGPPASQNEWELCWCLTAAQMCGDGNAFAAAKAEHSRRARNIVLVDEVEGQLPIIQPDFGEMNE